MLKKYSHYGSVDFILNKALETFHASEEKDLDKSFMVDIDLRNCYFDIALLA